MAVPGGARRRRVVAATVAALVAAITPVPANAAGTTVTPSTPSQPSNPNCPPPGYPGYPAYPGYPGYPTYPGYPGYPTYPGYPGYPGYPPYPPYPPYPCPPGNPPPDRPPPPVVPGTPRIEGPDFVKARVDRHGRFLLGRVIVKCPATPRLTCRVDVRQVAGRRVRILPLTFVMPPGRATKIRLQLTRASLRRLIRRRGARAAVEVTAQQATGPVATKRVGIRLLAPRRGHGSRARLRAFTGLAAPDRRALGTASTSGSSGPATGPAGLIAGISDQQAATFSDPRFRALGMHTARLVIPYDAMRTEPGYVAAWMSAAAAAGLDPLVAFDRAKGSQCPAAPCSLPTTADYAAGVRAFLDAYPRVRLVTPWNEANHAAEPTAGRPDRAAAYYDAARAVCPSCTLVAADVIDGPGMAGWLRAYRAALHEAPAVWGLHDYYDTTYFRTSGLQDMLATVRGDVWLTETGGIVELRNRAGAVTLPYDERRARASVSLAIETAKAFASRVKRMYVYQWRADPGDSFDAGLLRADGRPRPALTLVEDQLGAPADAASAAAVPGLAATRAAAGRPAVPRRLVVPANGRARIAVRCPARGSRCRGRLWLEGATFASGMLVNGVPPDDVLAPVGVRFSLRAGRGALLRFRVAAPVVHRAQAMRALRLRVSATTPEEPFGLRSRYVVAARPVRPRQAHR